MTTRLPISPSIQLRLKTVVVFDTPPLWLNRLIIFAKTGGSLAGAGRSPQQRTLTHFPALTESRHFITRRTALNLVAPRKTYRRSPALVDLDEAKIITWLGDGQARFSRTDRLPILCVIMSFIGYT
jgi:hypothetical protein